jgi:hypothetical protein
VKTSAITYLADEHLEAAFQEEHAATPPVNSEDGDERGDHVDSAHDHRGVQRRVLAEPDGVEQDGHVEHDGVDARELLEERDEDGHHQLRPVPPLQDVPERVLDPPGRFARFDHVLVLRRHVLCASDLRQDVTTWPRTSFQKRIN